MFENHTSLSTICLRGREPAARPQPAEESAQGRREEACTGGRRLVEEGAEGTKERHPGESSGVTGGVLGGLPWGSPQGIPLGSP